MNKIANSVSTSPACRENQKIPTLPQLWLDSFDGCERHTKHFELRTINDEPLVGFHIIALSSERATRQMIRKLQATSGVDDIKIFPVEVGSVAFEATTNILLRAEHLEYWLNRHKSKPLSLDEAYTLAEDILRDTNIRRKQRNIELAELRGRCGVPSFDWNEYIRDLEAEIHAAVDGKQNPTERKRLELKALAQERDQDKLTDGVIAFCRRYGWTRGDVEQRLRQLKTSTTTPKAQRLKGKDFLALETESISWVFPGIIPSRGVFVIGGHAGTGKSTFAYDAVGSLLLNEEFLGEKPVKTGKVLVVTGDELPCFTQDKLIDRGIPLDNENWEIILNWDISQWDVLEEAIADIRPALVVIDSFSSIHRDPRFDENSSQAKATIYDLEALTNAYGCGCILIHHLGKSKENQGVAKLRGSSAISAAASVVCLMEETPGGNRKVSFPKIRGAQTKPLLVTLDNSTGRYEVVSGGDDASTKTLCQQIIDFLAKHPGQYYESDEIYHALGLSNKDSGRQALYRNFQRGKVQKRPKQTGRGFLWKIAEPQLAHIPTNEDSPPPPCDKVSRQITETVTTQEIEVRDSNVTPQRNSNVTPKNSSEVTQSQDAAVEATPASVTDSDGKGRERGSDVTVGRYVRIKNTPGADGQIAKITQPANRHGLYSAKSGNDILSLHRWQFDLLSKAEVLRVVFGGKKKK